MQSRTKDDGLTSLREAARRCLRRNAFLTLRDHDAAMPRVAFTGIVVLLSFVRVACIAVLYVAHAGWLLDPSLWVDGAGITATHTTPFHGHPNPFGWRFGFQGLVMMHIITGIALFAVCLVPLFTAKGKPLHIRFGRAFVALWLVHLFNGLINSAQILLVRGFEPTRYPDTIGQGFSLYLYVQFAFISFLVIDFLAHGLAAIHYKNQPPGPLVRAVMLAMPTTSLLFGLALIAWSLLHLLSDTPPATRHSDEFAVIYLVQVPAYLYLTGKNIAYWLRPAPSSWLHGWLMEHQRNMMFCVQVTLYTGLANVTMRYADWLTPYVFGAIDAGFIIWLLLQERSLRRRVVESRFGLALVMLLRSGPASPHGHRPLSSSARRSIAQILDRDGSGGMDRDEARSLLEGHGIVPTDAELDHIFSTLDADGDGVVSPAELAPLLMRWFVPEPGADEELALAFRSLDLDGDGRISPSELCRALDTGDSPLTPAEVNELIASIDLDGDGYIDFRELGAALNPQTSATDAMA